MLAKVTIILFVFYNEFDYDLSIQKIAFVHYLCKLFIPGIFKL